MLPVSLERRLRNFGGQQEKAKTINLEAYQDREGCPIPMSQTAKSITARQNLLGSGSGIPRTYAQQFWPMTGNDLMACCLARHQAGAPSFIRSRVQRAPDIKLDVLLIVLSQILTLLRLRLSTER